VLTIPAAAVVAMVAFLLIRQLIPGA
jgi:hypothetical protein